MAKGLVTDTYLSNIADAIRTKNGTETQYKPSEMAAAITNLSTKARPNYVSFYQYGGASLDISWLDVSNITNMSNMFQNCSSLTTLDVSSWDTGNVASMNYMFSGCRSLTSLDISTWDIGKVTSVNSMFSNCSSLTSLNAGNLDASNIANMYSMFSGCSNLTSLAVSNWSTGKVTNMNSMFSGCKNLTVLDLSSFTTSETTNFMASSMFANCRKLTEVNISNMDLTRASTINYMFENCGSDNETPTIVYVKDEASQQKVLSTAGTPASWSTANVIIKEATT